MTSNTPEHRIELTHTFDHVYGTITVPVVITKTGDTYAATIPHYDKPITATRKRRLIQRIELHATQVHFAQQAKDNRKIESVAPTRTCPRCGGTGLAGPARVWLGTCYKCSGRGTIIERRKNVLPKMLRTGQITQEMFDYLSEAK